MKLLSEDFRYSYQGKFLCSTIMDFGNGKHNILNNAAKFKVLLPTSVAVYVVYQIIEVFMKLDTVARISQLPIPFRRNKICFK